MSTVYLGKIALILAALLGIVGLLLIYAPWTLSWFGSLPGDIRIESERSSIFIPITSMLILSGILSLLSYFFFR